MISMNKQNDNVYIQLEDDLFFYVPNVSIPINLYAIIRIENILPNYTGDIINDVLIDFRVLTSCPLFQIGRVYSQVGTLLSQEQLIEELL